LDIEDPIANVQCVKEDDLALTRFLGGCWGEPLQCEVHVKAQLPTLPQADAYDLALAQQIARSSPPVPTGQGQA
jgi:hypothetical protein